MLGAATGARRWPRIAAWTLIGAFLVLLYLPLLPPILFSVGLATPGASAVTFHAFAELSANPILVTATITTIEVAVIVGLAAPALGLLSALAVRALGAPRLVMLLILLPLFIPAISMGLATSFFFRELGIEPSILTVALVQTLWALPFATLVMLTAMSAFDPVLLEAAYVTGANRLRGFLDIELPIIRPGVFGAIVFSLILSFNETIRTSLVQGPLNTLQTYIWSTYKQTGLAPSIYALMTLLILLTLLLMTGIAAIAAGKVNTSPSSAEEARAG
ncbi:MAG: ABC transporter permease [Acetobacteraceae bacterium]